MIGETRIFERNNHSALRSFPVTLVGDGTLTNPFFVTATGDETRAHESTHVFAYDPTDPRFREASVFTNAQRMLDWFVGLGFDMRNERIGLSVNAVVNGSRNNALYNPPQNADDWAAIYITNGDGEVLQHLATDADVISHSLGHHVIYRTLRYVSNESLVVHEALADFFVMIRNGDPCLGRSLCPANSNAFAQRGQCLRSADNDLRWDDREVARMPVHQRGQIVSGMLWDIRESGTFTDEELAKLVLHAVDFLPERGGVVDLVAALFRADEQDFEGAFRGLIASKARERHLPVP